MFGRFLKDLKEYSYLSRYMARTGLKAEVANSYLNWIWWVLEPLASMVIYYLIFSQLLGRDQEYYVAFIYAGTLLWSYFERCTLFAVSAIRINQDIVTRTYIPKPILLVSNIIFNDFKMLISAVILVLVMILQGVKPTPWILMIIPMLLLMHLLTFGVGLILMHYGVFVDDLTHAMRIAMRILFYATGVFYNLQTILPAPWGEILVRVNPIAAIIQNSRACLLYGTAPEALTVIIWFAISILLCAVGLRLCYKYENTYVKSI